MVRATISVLNGATSPLLAKAPGPDGDTGRA
jgi:hypothetical protein